MNPTQRGLSQRAVNGCRYCGVLEREHANRWHADVGAWQNWVAPTDDQRLERLRGAR